VAFFPIDQSSRDRLATTPGVTIISNPLPHRPADVALVMAGLRCCEVFADGVAFRAAYHLRFGAWLPLAEGVAEDAAFAAIHAFLTLVGPLPTHYAPAQDAADRAAAATVLAAFSGLGTVSVLPAAA
jgi:hypothetical protein